MASSDRAQCQKYETLILPHVAAGFNLARWLIPDNQDAEDIVQESCLRAFKFLDGFHGTDARAWFLAIVRNTGYTWLQQNSRYAGSVVFDDENHAEAPEDTRPDRIAEREFDRETLKRALAAIPTEFREVIVLRELEGCSYKEIGIIAGIPLGTVMSRLARGRMQLAAVVKRNRGESYEL